MRGPSALSRRLAVSFGIVLTLAAQQASALFIVNQPWVRPAQRGQLTEAYMDITSTDGTTLVDVSSDAAATVAIRGPGKNAVNLATLALPAGAMVSLAPGGYRLVLTRLSRTVKRGDRVLFTLTIEATDGSRQDIPVNAEVRLHSPIDDERSAHKHTH